MIGSTQMKLEQKVDHFMVLETLAIVVAHAK